MTHTLITGGAGFIGSHLAEKLIARGDHVSIIDDESTGDVANLASIVDHPRLTYVKGSVGDADLVRSMLEDVDEVYHLAAAVGVRLIAEQPIHTLETNIYPTEMLLRELAGYHDAGRSVRVYIASTSEAYGKNPKAIWNEEDDLVFGPTTKARWSYGVSKAVDEFLALAYAQEKGLPVVIGRFFNVVGPRQTGAYGMVLPSFITAALDGRPLTVHDDGLQTRCFSHVDDVNNAIVKLLQTPEAYGRVFNIGSDQPITILDLAKKVIERTGADESLIEFQDYAEAYSPDFEDCRARVPDISRIRETIGFSPRFSLDDSIDQIIAFERAKR